MVPVKSGRGWQVEDLFEKKKIEKPNHKQFDVNL